MADRLITDIGGLPAGDIPKEEMTQLYWEKLMMAMFNVLWNKGIFNLDEFRRAVEQMPPDEYKASSFYGRRLDAMTVLLVEKGLVSREELSSRTAQILASGSRDHVR